jgi:hypothetical protein
MNLLELLMQLAIELVRALLVDELSDRIRRRAARLSFRTGRKQLNIAERVHLRVRNRLLHRLTTEERQKL